jgi:Xaa-Pro aminopeptidase
MPVYRATIQLTKLEGRDPAAVRSDLEQAFARAGIGQCRIVAVEDEQIIASAPSRRIPYRPPVRRRAVNRGILLLVGAAIWAVWFFWKLMGPE